MNALVFDASALFNFGHRGELEAILLRLATTTRLLVARPVAKEVSGPERRAYYEAILRDHFTLQDATTVTLDRQALAELACRIGPGEIGTILLARELQATAVLDDRLARSQALGLQVTVIGTIGLLDFARQQGWLTEADCLAAVVRMRQAKAFLPPLLPGQSFLDYLASFG